MQNEREEGHAQVPFLTWTTPSLPDGARARHLGGGQGEQEEQREAVRVERVQGRQPQDVLQEKCVHLRSWGLP